MENAIPKIKSGISSAPLWAVGGAIAGMLVAKQLNFHKTITIVPFAMVGLIIGFSIGSKMK